MRAIKLFVVVTLILVGSHFIPADGQNSEVFQSLTKLNAIPASLATGSTITLSSHTTDNFGTNVPFGEVNFYDLTEDEIGQGRNGSTSSNNPSIEFNASTSTSINGFKIPSLSISKFPTSVYWKVYENNIMKLSGKILKNELVDSLNSSQSIFVLFNSHQTSFQQNNLILSAVKTYKIELTVPTSTSMTFPKAMNSTAFLH